MDSAYNSYKRQPSKTVINKETCKKKLLHRNKPKIIILVAATLLVAAVCILIGVTGLLMAHNENAFYYILNISFILCGAAAIVYLIIKLALYWQEASQIKKGNFDITEERVVSKTLEDSYRWKSVGKGFRKCHVTEYVIYLSHSGRYVLYYEQEYLLSDIYVEINSGRSEYYGCNEGDIFYVVKLRGKNQKPRLIYNSATHIWRP